MPGQNNPIGSHNIRSQNNVFVENNSTGSFNLGNSNNRNALNSQTKFASKNAEISFGKNTSSVQEQGSSINESQHSGANDNDSAKLFNRNILASGQQGINPNKMTSPLNFGQNGAERKNTCDFGFDKTAGLTKRPNSPGRRPQSPRKSSMSQQGFSLTPQQMHSKQQGKPGELI